MSHFDRLQTEVISKGLCTRCGTCVGVCPEGALEFADPLGQCLPVTTNTDACTNCPGWCYSGCSGKEVHFPTLNAFTHGKQPDNVLLGEFVSLYVGHATDERIRRAGASGGIISTLAIYMLEKGLVDGVIALGPKKGQPWEFEPTIARSREEVIACAQSKYSISPTNTILSALSREPEDARFAFAGIPCQVHSIRKLQAQGHPAARKIVYIIGSYCGNILHFDAVRSFLRRYRVNDHQQVVKLEYRAGEWPGKMRVELQDGRVLEMPKFYANYLIPFHIMRRCLTCTDLANEFADISGGDAWAPVYEERGKGYSLMIGRTPRGQALLDQAIKDGLLAVDLVTVDSVVNMHSHMLDSKKRGAFLRMDRLGAVGKQTPEYGYRPVTPVPLKRQLIERVLQFVYWFCSFKFSLWLINLVPDEVIGTLFKNARSLWKSSTRSTKKQSLNNLAFALEPPRTLAYEVPPAPAAAPVYDRSRSPVRSVPSATDLARQRGNHSQTSKTEQVKPNNQANEGIT